MFEGLGNNFNIVPRKSLILRPLNNLTNEFSKNFIRGYVDGDGWIIKNTNTKRIGILGTKEMLEWIKNILRKN